MRKLKRDELWDAILESEIFDNPALWHDGSYWCVTFDDPAASSGIGLSFITIGRNIKRALQWVTRNKGNKYPQ